MATYSYHRPRGIALAALVVFLCCLCRATPTVGTWGGSGSGKPKLDAGFVKLHFYLQEQLGSSLFVVVPPLPGHGTSFFGTVLVADQNATATPDPASTVIARVKGSTVVADNKDSGPLGAQITTTAVFNDASGYSGSSLSFQGFNDLVLADREISITGGTGKFRLARGWLEFSTYFEDAAEGRDIVDVTAYVYYGGK